MSELHFSMGTMLGYVTEGIMVILIPVLLLIFWKRQTKASLIPAIVGMVIFPLFGILLKLIPGYFLLIMDNPVSRAINGNVWLYSIIGGGLLAGLFEEGGRFVAFRFLLKKHTDRKTAISYGIGHGGFESAYVGVSVMSYLMIGLMVNTGNTSLLFEGLDEANAAALTAQLETIAATPFWTPAVLGVLERCSAIVFHISMSVFVFAAAREKKYIFLFPTAILLHTMLNGSTVFVQLGWINTIGMECFIAAFAAATAYLASRIYKKL